jgi:surface polysaccharide O-acyltransferase-like enzyme
MGGMQTPRNLTIDSVRLLAALEVIALHVTFSNLPPLIAAGIRLQARWAVPFFFIISGYFLARRLADPQQAGVRSSIYRLIWVFLLWSALYVPLVIHDHGVKEVFRRLLFASFVYIGEYFHLWFPSSMVFGFIALLFFFHYKLEKWLPLISIGILIHILLAGSYNQVFNIKFPFDFVIARHWISVPALALGVWLFRRGPLNRWLALALLLGGFALQVFETWFLAARFGIPMYDHEILVGTLPFAFGISSLAVSGWKPLEIPFLSSWGKDYSLGVYLSHVVMKFALGLIVAAGLPALQKLAVWDIVYPFIILLACIGILAALRRWLPAVFRLLMGDHRAHDN